MKASTQEKIQALIELRNNGDVKAQSKIDILFNQHRSETENSRNENYRELSEANAEAYAN